MLLNRPNQEEENEKYDEQHYITTIKLGLDQPDGITKKDMIRYGKKHGFHPCMLNWLEVKRYLKEREERNTQEAEA